MRILKPKTLIMETKKKRVMRRFIAITSKPLEGGILLLFWHVLLG
jgi:hypothetical protein